MADKNMEQKISDEFARLENQFVDMQRTLEKIKEKISYKNQAAIDFNHLEKEAANNSIAHHPISQSDKELVYRYCLALALIAETSGDNETRIKQYYYIFRVYHASYDDFICEELLRDVKLVSLDGLDFIKENYSLEQLENFFVDLLLLCIIGNKQDKQMDLFCELAAFLGMTAKQLNLVCLITKAILEKDEEALLEIAREKDINAYYPYFGCIPKYYVVSKISDINSVSGDCVLVFGEKIQDINEIMDFDDYDKKEIYFKNCCFDNILGIKSKKTSLHFIGCRFENCKQEKLKKSGWGNLRYENGNPTAHFMECNNAQITNTVFDSCTLLGIGQNSSVFEFKNSVITECKFSNCSIGVSVHHNATGSVIHAVDTSIVNCEITGCSAYGEGNYGQFDTFHMRIVSIQQGRITDTKFVNCDSDSQYVSDRTDDDYILVFNDRCKEINNEFINCKAEQTTNYGGNRYHEVKIQRNKD